MEDRELENRIGKWRKKGTSAKLEKECNTTVFGCGCGCIAVKHFFLHTKNNGK